MTGQGEERGLDEGLRLRAAVVAGGGLLGPAGPRRSVKVLAGGTDLLVQMKLGTPAAADAGQPAGRPRPCLRAPRGRRRADHRRRHHARRRSRTRRTVRGQLPGHRRGGRRSSARCRCAAGRRSAATSATPPRRPTWRPSSSPTRPKRSSPTGGPSARVPLEEFFTGPGETVLGPGELLKALRRARRSRARATPSTTRPSAPPWTAAPWASPSPPSSRRARPSLQRRPPGTRGRGAHAHPRTGRPRGWLLGQPLDEGLIERVSAQAAAEARPISDVRASAEYRTTLVEVLTRRALNGRTLLGGARRAMA